MALARPLARVWRGALAGLAAVGGAILGAMFVAIVADVLLRSAGLQPPLWTGMASEFGLLYATMLAAPWLIGRDGHIRVRALVDRLPAVLSARLETLVLALLALLCAVLAYYALDVVLDTARRGELEYRTVIVPRWTLFAPMPLGFALCAAEFARLAIAGVSDRTGAADAERSL